jgi:hypothetical protein
MNEVLSLLVWYRHDRQTDTMQLQIVNVDTGKEVHLTEGSFLLRVFSLEGGLVQRCFIRHIASGREAYIQGGSHLQVFVKECLLQVPESFSESSTSGGQEELSNGQRADGPDDGPESPPPEDPGKTGK